MASLRESQRAFAAALRNPAVACAVVPPANLAIYRNNASVTFRVALERTFPVVLKRVGEDYFRKLCADYREKFPSRSGDLHWVGRDFGGFLENHLHGTEYAWLADLARLEWLLEEISLLDEPPGISADCLGRFAPQELENLVFTLQSSLRLHSSSYPVFTIWLANQEENAPPVDQSLGSEQGMVRIRANYSEVRLLAPALVSYLSALAEGKTLAEAVDIAGFDEADLTRALAFLFSENLVSSVTVKGGAAAL